MALNTFKCNNLFTSPTRTRQNGLVLSCLVRIVGHAITVTVLSCLGPVSTSFVSFGTTFQFATLQPQIYWGLLAFTANLETENWVKTRQNCLVLSAVVFTPPTHGQDKTVLSCPCRRCEQAITDCRTPAVGLPTVTDFPGHPVSWPYCPASRPIGLPGTPNVAFFGRAQMVLKWCSKCMRDRNVLASKSKLGKSILRKIIKIVATRCHILKLKYIKFDFGCGSAPEQAGELTAPPDPYSCI